MKKEDLKNGMIVELRNGNRRLVWEDYMYNLDTSTLAVTNHLSYYNDDLINRNSKNLDIMKVLDREETLWERRKRTDWNKVPFGAKVKCKSMSGDVYNGLFVKYDKTSTHPYLVYVEKHGEPLYCKSCELLEESKEEITAESLHDEYKHHCRKYNDECDGCDYGNVSGYCMWNWILGTFNLTRK